MKTNDFNEAFFFVGCFLAVFVCFASGTLHKYTFLLVGKLLSFWGKPHLSRSSSAGVVVPCAPWWVVATARWCGPIRRRQKWENSCRWMRLVHRWCVFLGVLYTKTQEKHGEDMVGWWVWNLLLSFCLVYVLREWEEAMCYWPSFQGNWHRLQWECLSLCS